jgi:hypothetical protein
VLNSRPVILIWAIGGGCLIAPSQTGHKTVMEAPVSGTDFGAVIKKLRSANSAPTKGEFESTSAFEERKAAIPDDLRAPMVFPLLNGSAAATYNADKEVMTVRLLPKFRFGAGGGGYSLALRLTREDAIPYSGLNSFGVRKEILNWSEEETGIVARNLDQFCILSYPMAVEKAKQLKPFFAFAITGTLKSAVVYDITSRHPPTMSEPWDTKTVGQYIPIVALTLAIVDTRDGSNIGVAAFPKEQVRRYQ